ncbi:MAG: c-type cytochrome [Isosphaeraceae bacterium]
MARPDQQPGRRRGPDRPTPPDQGRKPPRWPRRSVGSPCRPIRPSSPCEGARAAGPEDPALVAACKAGGLGDAPRAFTAEEKLQILASVATQGNAARGEQVFRRKENQCLKCHAIAGRGGQVGPSLESIGASAPPDYLLDSLLEPGKAVKENYHSLVVATTEGQVISGIKLRQSDRELVLRDAEDREVSVPLSAIEEQKPGGSLMPAGLVEPLTRAELIDLVRFLSELGKIGPYSVSKARVVRRWQTLEPNNEAYTDIRALGHAVDRRAANVNRYPDGQGGAAAPSFGRLPTAPWPATCRSTRSPCSSFRRWPARERESGPPRSPLPARRFDAGGGQARVQLARGLAWIDGTAVEAAEEVVANLAGAPHADPRHQPFPSPAAASRHAGRRTRLAGPCPGRRGQVGPRRHR